MNSISEKLKPAVAKKYLLFIAGAAWTIAGSILWYKGFSFVSTISDWFWLKIVLSLSFGFLFYWVLFSKISNKHIKRIINLPNNKPCLFSFFNTKSYILMAIMISCGIFLRKTGWLPSPYLSLFYITMGTPLLISALRFFYEGIWWFKKKK